MIGNVKLCFILLFLVLLYWPNPTQSESVIFPTDKITLDGRCRPPLCFTPSIFPLPEAVLAGTFYGTNTCGTDDQLTDDELPDKRCQASFAFPIPTPGEIFPNNGENIPVALVQVTQDGIYIFNPAVSGWEYPRG